MKIPSSIQLMGHTVTVTVVPPIKWKVKGCVGLFNPADMTILIRKGTQSTMEHSYLHELGHAILYCLNNSLYDDEAFVDTYAGLLHQAMTSAKYPEPRQTRRTRKA
jgi:hypothetical protein